MTLQECYDVLDGGYEEVMGRLMRESMVERFVLKFLQDKSYSQLVEAMENKDQETAFRAAHTLKGVSQTLSFTRLFRSSNAMTEALRDGGWPSDPGLLEQVKQDYQQTVSAIEQFQAEKG